VIEIDRSPVVAPSLHRAALLVISREVRLVATRHRRFVRRRAGPPRRLDHPRLASRSRCSR